jgi:hypothetical protein
MSYELASTRFTVYSTKLCTRFKSHRAGEVLAEAPELFFIYFCSLKNVKVELVDFGLQTKL